MDFGTCSSTKFLLASVFYPLVLGLVHIFMMYKQYTVYQLHGHELIAASALLWVLPFDMDKAEVWITIARLWDKLADIVRDSLEKGDLRALDYHCWQHAHLTDQCTMFTPGDTVLLS